MNLGNFSLSLNVNDLAASRAFYEALGFSVFHDASEYNFMILKSPTCVIGLFKGMFDQNIMTFNPGWDANGEPLAQFEDIRSIQQRVMDAGIKIIQQSDETGTGPASFTVIDPDGNPVLIDQHVDAPKHHSSP